MSVYVEAVDGDPVTGVSTDRLQPVEASTIAQPIVDKSTAAGRPGTIRRKNITPRRAKRS
jgi:hypothetical protein